MAESSGTVEFTKPGQKFATPSPGAGDRVFYESLFIERPTSIMAMRWCVEHGIFRQEIQEKVYKEQYLPSNKDKK